MSIAHARTPSLRVLVASAVIATGVASIATAPTARAVTPTPYYPVMDLGPHNSSYDEPATGIRLTQVENRLVYFTTRTPLTPDDTDSQVDLYVQDRLLGQYTRASRPTGGAGTANTGDVTAFDTDPGGQFSVFVTTSTNMSNGPGLYLYDWGNSRTMFIAAGPVADVSFNSPTVVWSTPAPSPHVYWEQLAGNQFGGDGIPVEIPLPTGTAGTPGHFAIDVPGTTVAFTVRVTRTIGNVTETNPRVLVYDQGDDGFGDIIFVPRGSGVVPGAADLTAAGQEPATGQDGKGSTSPSLNGDGSILSFASTFGDLVEGDTNGVSDVFVRDLVSPGLPLTRISLSITGTQVDGAATDPDMNGDGRVIVFLGHDGTTGFFGAPTGTHVVYWEHTGPSGPRLLDASVTWTGSYSASNPRLPVVDVGGRFVAYATDSTLATPAADNDGALYDLVLWDRSASSVDTSVGADGVVATQPTLTSTDPVGMRATVPTGGHVLLTKEGARVLPPTNIETLNSAPDPSFADSFQAFIPTQTTSAPAQLLFGVDPSLQPHPQDPFQRLTVAVDGAELPACAGSALPVGVATCQEPVTLDGTGVRSIVVLTTQTPGNQIDLGWGLGSSPPAGTTDTVPPVETLTTPPSNSTGVYQLDATVYANYSCADEFQGSGIATCVGSVPNGSAIDTSSVGVHTFSVTGTDNTGNHATVSATYTVLDQVVGSVSAGQVTTVSTGSTTSTAVPVQTAVTTSSAGGSGSVSVTEGPTTQSAPAQYSFLNYEVAITVPDGTAAAPLSIVFALDGSILTPAGLDYLTVQITRNGTPLGSCATTPMPCVALRESLPGNGARITVNTVSASKWNFGRRAAFTLGNFAQPVDNPPTLNKAKAGSAVPVKFSLNGFQGMSIIADTYPRSTSISCSSTAPVDALESTASPGASTLSYDATTDLYTYVWKTDKSWTGCRQLTLKFAEGSIRSALFQFTK